MLWAYGARRKRRTPAELQPGPKPTSAQLFHLQLVAALVFLYGVTVIVVGVAVHFMGERDFLLVATR